MRFRGMLELMKAARLGAGSYFLAFCLLVSPLALAQSSDGQFDADGEQQLLQLVNQERTKRGIPGLKLDDRLTEAARQHSILLSRNRQLSHQFTGEPNLPRRLAATGLRFGADAENVAFDQTIDNAHAGLMLSPGHRANILNADYNAIGIGVVRQGDLVYITEDFATRLPYYTDAQAEDRVATAFEHLDANRPVRRVVDSRLRSMACGMAKADQLDTQQALTLPNVSAAVTFTATEPDHLPSSAVRVRNRPTTTSYAVGACFAASPHYLNGVYWVVMVFY